MYKKAEAALDRVLELVNKCPKELQEKCFEILLSGYVQLEVVGARGEDEASRGQRTAEKEQRDQVVDSSIPAAALPRFKHAAKRLGIAVEKLESLFDFTVDPFALQPMTLPGKDNANKTREVALLAASRSYFATGTWSADWQEVKSLCIDHNCYDSPNHAANLKKGANGIFKGVESGKSIELSNTGIQKADKLLRALAEASAE